MRVVIKNFNMTASEMERQWAEQDNYIKVKERFRSEISLLTVSVQWLESEPRSEQQNSNPEVASKSAETKENSGKKSRHKSRRKSRGQEACRDLGLVNKDFPSVGSSESRASVKSTRIYTVECGWDGKV